MNLGRLALWVVNAALFTLCCFLTAGLFNAGLGAWLAGPPEIPTARPPAPATAAHDWADRAVILDRNLFQVSTLLPTPAASDADETPEEELEATRLPLTLLGTAASTDPAHAWAAVVDNQTRKQMVVRANDVLLDKATVVRIERRRLVLENGGKREELALDDHSAVGSNIPRPPGSASLNDLRSRIQRLSDNSFQVSREDVSHAVQNPAELFSQARILPKYEDGQMVGVQLSSIKPGSLFEEIGIQNGDTVTQVNGITVTSPQDSAALLRELTQATDFQVTVVGADGQTRTLSYAIGE
jgi:general secretion pathway protein C